MYATTRSEAEKSDAVVTGTLPIMGHYALVLFDYGSSHSFVSSSFVKHGKFELESLSYVLSISIPSGEVVFAKEQVKACQIEIPGHMLNGTLIVFDMHDFDIILIPV